jgi:hypothetical protein
VLETKPQIIAPNGGPDNENRSIVLGRTPNKKPQRVRTSVPSRMLGNDRCDIFDLSILDASHIPFRNDGRFAKHCVSKSQVRRGASIAGFFVPQPFRSRAHREDVVCRDAERESHRLERYDSQEGVVCACLAIDCIEVKAR